MKYITDIDQALNFLYPQGFLTENFHQRAVLCATNNNVDEWNAKVQELNPETPYILHAKNEFSNIDDPKRILGCLLTSDACMF